MYILFSLLFMTFSHNFMQAAEKEKRPIKEIFQAIASNDPMVLLRLLKENPYDFTERSPEGKTALDLTLEREKEVMSLFLIRFMEKESLHRLMTDGTYYYVRKANVYHLQKVGKKIENIILNIEPHHHLIAPVVVPRIAYFLQNRNHDDTAHA